jgi:hypothetical protein
VRRTREIWHTAREGWRLLGPAAKVGLILFEVAWLVQIGILVYLFAS